VAAPGQVLVRRERSYEALSARVGRQLRASL